MPDSEIYKPSKIITTEVELMGKKKMTNFTLTVELVKATIKNAKEFKKTQQTLLDARAKIYNIFSPRNKEISIAFDSGRRDLYDNLSEKELEIYESEKKEVEAFAYKMQFDYTVGLLKNFYAPTSGGDIYKKLISAKDYDETWDSIDLGFIADVEETVAYWFRKATLIG